MSSSRSQLNLGFGPSNVSYDEIDLPTALVEIPVELNNPVDGDVLIFNGTQQVFKNEPSKKLVDGGNF